MTSGTGRVPPRPNAARKVRRQAYRVPRGREVGQLTVFLPDLGIRWSRWAYARTHEEREEGVASSRWRLRGTAETGRDARRRERRAHLVYLVRRRHRPARTARSARYARAEYSLFSVSDEEAASLQDSVGLLGASTSLLCKCQDLLDDLSERS